MTLRHSTTTLGLLVLTAVLGVGAWFVYPRTDPSSATPRPTAQPESKDQARAELADWRLDPASDDSVAISPSYPGLRIALPSEGSGVSLQSWRIAPENPVLGILTFGVGLVGTSQKYAITRAALVRLTDGHVLGFPVVAYAPYGDAPPLDQPVWSWHDGRLVVNDIEFSETHTY